MSALRQKFHDHADGSFTIESVQDIAPYLERNKAERDEWNRLGPRKDEAMRKIASVPTVIVEKWLREHGVDVFNKDHMHKVRQLLRSPEYSYLRTTTGRI